jgi:hypothetical protein
MSNEKLTIKRTVEPRVGVPPTPTFRVDKRSKARKIVDGVHGSSNLFTYSFLAVSIGLSCIIGLCFAIGFIKYVFVGKHGMLALMVIGIPCGIFLFGFIYSMCTGNCFDPSQKVIDVMGEDGEVETYQDVNVVVRGVEKPLSQALEENPNYLNLIEGRDRSND